MPNQSKPLNNNTWGTQLIDFCEYSMNMVCVFMCNAIKNFEFQA